MFNTKLKQECDQQARKIAEQQAVLAALDRSSAVIEFTPDGIIQIAAMSTKIREGTEVGISSVTSMLNQAEHGVSLANDAGDAISRMRESTNEVVRVINKFSAIAMAH